MNVQADTSEESSVYLLILKHITDNICGPGSAAAVFYPDNTKTLISCLNGTAITRTNRYMIYISAAVCKLDARNAFRIWKRDRRNHASPNSAQTESAYAGVLHVRLAGDAWYFGKD